MLLIPFGILKVNKFLLIIGSPFKIYVDTIQSGYVTAHGPGLTRGIAGEPANFTIFTKETGGGKLIVIFISQFVLHNCIVVLYENL